MVKITILLSGVVVAFAAGSLLAQEPADDLSSDALKAFAGLRSSMKAGDVADCVAKLHADPKGVLSPSVDAIRSHWLNKPDSLAEQGRLWDALQFRDEADLPKMALQRYRLGDATKPLPVKILYFSGPSRSPAQISTIAMVFVQQGGEWRWYPVGQAGYDGWEYDLSKPENAYRALLLAIERQDAGGVFEMIDPAMRVGMDRGGFVQTASSRLEAIAQWKSEVEQKRSPQSRPSFTAENPPQVDWDAVLNNDPAATAQLDAWREQQIGAARRKEKESAKHNQPAPPFIAIRKAPSSKVDVSRRRSGEQEFADVWPLDPYEGRIWGERFIRNGDRWYWQPKSEYTAWPQLDHQSQ